MQIKIERLRRSTSPEFDALVRIYEASLPDSERKSTAVLRQMILRPEYFFLVARMCDRIVGMSISAVLTGTDAGLLEYLAIAPEHRGRQLGQKLFLATASYELLTDRHLLLEVESDRIAGHSGQHSAKRKAFYRRLGCRQIEGLAYRMPQVSAQPPPPMEMLLYSSNMPASIDTAKLREWLEACYQQVYGEPRGDARIGEMLAELPAQVRLV